MTHNRRTILGLISATMMLPASALRAQQNAQPDTQRLQRELDEATLRGRPWQVPAGLTLSGPLRLPDGAHLIGQRGRSRLALMGDGPLLLADKAQRLTLEGVSFDGNARAGGRDIGLLQFKDVADLKLQDCTIERFGGNGLMLERCGGRISTSTLRDNGRGAIFARDSRGLLIDSNLVERAGENGILVWRSSKGDDGTIIRSNRIQDIRATAGGTGEFGNAIGLFRAGGVIAEGNVIRRVTFSAVRNNGGSNVVVANNTIAACGEAAIFIEFAFDGVAITGNIVDGAVSGIVVANFADHNGYLTTIAANVLRNFRSGPRPGDGKVVGGQGLIVEGDAAITGNIIERAEVAGMQLGWGPSLRDITASGNTIRDCGNGIEISVAPGAGHVAIIGNMIAGSKKQAIVGMQWLKQVTGDLAVSGAKDWPKLKLAENVIR